MADYCAELAVHAPVNEQTEALVTEPLQPFGLIALRRQRRGQGQRQEHAMQHSYAQFTAPRLPTASPPPMPTLRSGACSDQTSPPAGGNPPEPPARCRPASAVWKGAAVYTTADGPPTSLPPIPRRIERRSHRQWASASRLQ